MKERAIFFDRDGTINEEKDYIFDPALIELIPGALEGLKLASEAGFRLFIVSNQSGIARGLATETDVCRVNERLEELVAVGGVHFDGIYFCPHLPTISGHCDCRKPKRGMVDRALETFDLDLANSFVVGDRLLDMQLAHNIGATGIMVRTGYGSVEEHQIEADGRPAYIVDNLLEAVKVILKEQAA